MLDLSSAQPKHLPCFVALASEHYCVRDASTSGRQIKHDVLFVPYFFKIKRTNAGNYVVSSVNRSRVLEVPLNYGRRAAGFVRLSGQ